MTTDEKGPYVEILENYYLKPLIHVTTLLAWKILILNVWIFMPIWNPRWPLLQGKILAKDPSMSSCYKMFKKKKETWMNPNCTWKSHWILSIFVCVDRQAYGVENRKRGRSWNCRSGSDRNLLGFMILKTLRWDVYSVFHNS